MSKEALFFELYDKVAESKRNCILFVSSKAGEGTTHAILECANTYIDYFPKTPVLLIDLNINNPELSKQAGMPNEGWCTWDGKTATLNRLYVKNRNIHILPAGTFEDKDDVFQISMKNLPEIFKHACKEFSLVLLDCSPIMDSSLPLVVAKMTDFIILIVEAGKTRKQVITLALEKLLKTGTEIGGVILNKRKYFIPQSVYNLFLRGKG